MLLSSQSKYVFIVFLMAFSCILYYIDIVRFVCWFSFFLYAFVFVFFFWILEFFACLFVSIDRRFITLFAYRASCHDWMTLFRSRYSSYVFPFFYSIFVLFLLLNNIECMMWSVIFEIDKSLCWRTKEWQRRNRKKKFKTHFTLNEFASTSWIELVLFLSCWNDDLVALIIFVV